jgi:competence protein ComGC
MKSTNHKGFSHFETILLLVVVAVISVVGFTVYSRNNKSKADTDPAVVLRQQNQSRQPEMYDPDKTTPEEQESLAAAGLLTEANANAASNKTMARKSSNTKVKWIPYAPRPIVKTKDYWVNLCVDFMNEPTNISKTNIYSFIMWKRPPYTGASAELSHKKGWNAPKYDLQLVSAATELHSIMGINDYITLTVRKPGKAYVVANKGFLSIDFCKYWNRH